MFEPDARGIGFLPCRRSFLFNGLSQLVITHGGREIINFGDDTPKAIPEW